MSRKKYEKTKTDGEITISEKKCSLIKSWVNGFTKPLSDTTYPSYESASWYKRFASFFLDTTLVVPIYLLFLYLITLLDIKNDISELFIQSTFSLIFFAYIISSWIIFKGQTFGQFVMKTRIVSDKDEDISILQAISRLLGFIASNIMVGIGFLTIFVTKDKKCLHDMTSQSRVIDLNKVKTLS